MSKSFNIRYDVDVTMSVEELWPDGDAPANPTAADVEALIEADGGWREILWKWNLHEDADTSVHEMKPFVPRVKRTVEP